MKKKASLDKDYASDSTAISKENFKSGIRLVFNATIL